MSTACAQLPLFVDGELPPSEAEMFTWHLASCPRCPAALSELLVMDDLVARPSPRTVPIPHAHPVAVSERPAGRPGRRPGFPWRLSVAAMGLALAGATALFLVWPQTPPQADSLVAALADTPYRSHMARLSYAAADRHRPFNPLRAAGGSDPGRAPAPLATLAAVEARGDTRGLAAAYFLLGMPAQAAAHLPADEGSADRLNDRAAALLEQGQIDAAGALLERALRLSPRHRQARWNQALVLRARGDREAGARVFAELARDGEAGWAEEASSHARDLLP